MRTRLSRQPRHDDAGWEPTLVRNPRSPAMCGTLHQARPLLLRDGVVLTQVMTSVYGVTQLGAKDQIINRLKERGIVSDEHVSRAANYGAKVQPDGWA